MRIQTRDTAGSTDGAGEQQRAYPSAECPSALPQRPLLAAPPTRAHSVPDSRLPEHRCSQSVRLPRNDRRRTFQVPVAKP